MSANDEEPQPTTIVDRGGSLMPSPTTIVDGSTAPPLTTLVGAPPVTTMVPSGSGTAGTTLVADGSVAIDWVPPEVFARFPGLNPSHAGAEAVVFTGESAQYGPVAVKVYRRGLAADTDVARVLKEHANLEHVVALTDSTEIGGCWVEVLERIDKGSLIDLAAGRPLRGDPLHAVVAELSAAIAHFHSLGLIHRDIKPANVLVRTDDPLDLVLADFGLAAILTDDVDLQAQNRTVMYASPETQMGLRDPTGDWWSLGIIVVELYCGRHPFADFSNATILTHLIARDIDLSAVDDERWRMLCSGLLDRDPATRWGSEQVNDWLAGGSPAVHRQAPTRTPYEFGGEAFDSPESLLAAFSLDWAAAVRRVSGHTAYRQLCDWLTAGAPGDGELAVTLDSIGDEVDGDSRLFRLLRQLAPHLPPIYRGYAVDDGGVAGLAAAAIRSGETSPEMTAVDSLWTNQALRWLPDGETLDREWRDGWSAVIDMLGDHRSLDAVEETTARARLLLAVCSADEGRVLREQAVAAGRSDAGSIGWYRLIASRGSTSTTAALAAVLLRETASGEARQEAAERKAAKDEVLRARRQVTTRRYPRTRVCLGVTLIMVVLLSVATIAARFVQIDPPSSYDGPVHDDGSILLFDVLNSGYRGNEAMEFFRPYLLGIANPLWPVLLLVIGSVFFVRARGVGSPGSSVTRSELERRGMQAVITGSCVYFPVLAPFALFGLYRGLYTNEAGVRTNRFIRWALNIAGVGYLLHAAAIIITRSPQLSDWTARYPSWYWEFLGMVPAGLLATVQDHDGSRLIVLPLLVAGVASLALAARTLQGQPDTAELLMGILLVPLGLYSLVPGLLIAGFYPMFGLGIGVAVVLGVIAAVIGGFLILGLAIMLLGAAADS